MTTDTTQRGVERRRWLTDTVFSLADNPAGGAAGMLW